MMEGGVIRVKKVIQADTICSAKSSKVVLEKKASVRTGGALNEYKLHCRSLAMLM